MDYIGYIIAGVVLLLGIVLLVCGYLKAPPDTAYIISGFRKRRILIGKAGWRIPFFERVDRISLRVMQVDVKTSEAVPTNESRSLLTKPCSFARRKLCSTWSRANLSPW